MFRGLAMDEQEQRKLFKEWQEERIRLAGLSELYRAQVLAIGLEVLGPQASPESRDMFEVCVCVEANMRRFLYHLQFGEFFTIDELRTLVDVFHKAGQVFSYLAAHYKEIPSKIFLEGWPLATVTQFATAFEERFRQHGAELEASKKIELRERDPRILWTVIQICQRALLGDDKAELFKMRVNSELMSALRLLSQEPTGKPS